MKITVQTKIKSSKGLLVVPVFKETIKKLPSNYPKLVQEFIKTAHKNKDLKASEGATISTYNLHKGLPEKILVISLGSSKELSLRTAKEAGGKIGKYAKGSKSADVSILMPKEVAAQAQHLVEGLLMAQYVEERLGNSKKKKDSYELKNIEIVAEKDKALTEALERAVIVSRGARYVKDLVNLPSNLVDAQFLVKESKRIAKANKYKLKIITQKELKKLKWGALLAVNQGSKKEAACIAIQYDGAKNKKEKPVVIVGKGIIFDTGGYNLKPTHHIETMQQDMAGGAVVLGVFEALKKMKIKKNVVGVIPIAENLISAEAYRPSDIITSYSGKTIEITNTDAEGRLILADGITYGTKFKPEAIITIATLTGAVAVATGDRYSGIIGNNSKLRSDLRKAGEETDDLGWELPIHRDFRKKMKSKVADLTNYDMGSGRFAGASKAAAFLENFVEKNKWSHIDIGGTAFTTDPKEYQTKGATASGLEMLLKFLENA